MGKERFNGLHALYQRFPEYIEVFIYQIDGLLLHVSELYGTYNDDDDGKCA